MRPGRPPLRVALVSDWYLPRRGGIELHLADLARRLAAAGHLVDVLTPLPAGEAAADDAAAAGAGVRVRRLAVARLPWAGVACTPALLGAVGDALDAGAADGRPYDVVHAHASVVSPTAWAGVREARRRGLPCVVTAHSLLGPRVRALGAADRLTGWARGRVLVTGVSAAVADGLRAALPRARVAVLANATDVGWWRPVEGAARGTPRGAGGRRAGGVPARAPGEVRLVTAMRFAGRKRPLVLVDLLAAATAAAPPGRRVRLVAAGDGPIRTALVRAARARGLADALVLPGWLPRPALRALYHDAHAFVLPTARESFGIAALEARAAGLPVLGLRGNGLAEFVHDRCGCPGDPGAWAHTPAARAERTGVALAGVAAGPSGGWDATPDTLGVDAVDPAAACPTDGCLGPDGVLAADDGALARAVARLVADAAWRRALRRASAARPPCDFDWPAVVARHEAAYRAAGECPSDASFG